MRISLQRQLRRYYRPASFFAGDIVIPCSQAEIRQNKWWGGYLFSSLRPSKTHDSRLLIFVLSTFFVTVFGVAAFFRLTSNNTTGTIAQLVKLFAHVQQGTDSWEPMLKSLDYFHAHPESPI